MDGGGKVIVHQRVCVHELLPTLQHHNNGRILLIDHAVNGSLTGNSGRAEHVAVLKKSWGKTKIGQH